MDYDSRPWLNSYDEWVEPDLQIPDQSIVDLLAESARRFPDRVAYHFLGTRMTFAEFARNSRRFADYLREGGASPGDVVAINLPNVPQYLIAQAGTLMAGCAATGLSPLLTPKEMAYQLQDSGARVLVTLDAIFEKRFLGIQEQVPALQHVVVTGAADLLPAAKRFLAKLLKKIPTGRIVPIAGKSVIAFPRVLKEFDPEAALPPVSSDSVALIQYTGGTTGVPKGTVLTHRNLVANILQAEQWADMTRGTEIYCSAFPFFHLAGLAFGLGGLAMGATQVLIVNPRDTRRVCAEIARHRPSVLCNVPTLYQMLLNEPRFRRLDFSGCKICVSGAAPFSVEALKRLSDVVGEGKVMEVYGMTEASPLITMNPHKRAKRLGSVGLPIQSTHVRLVDLTSGERAVPIGEEGELIVRGPQVMKEYHNQPGETAKTLREFEGETWLYTGDVGRMDADGFLTLVDRAKDMLIVGGFKVFSQEVEETLLKHSAVDLCAIIGLANPDRPGSEVVKCVIQLAPDHGERDENDLKKDILGYCQTTMAPYKIPKIIEFVTDMPLTPVGKVDKKELRNRSA